MAADSKRTPQARRSLAQYSPGAELAGSQWTWMKEKSPAKHRAGLPLNPAAALAAARQD